MAKLFAKAVWEIIDLILLFEFLKFVAQNFDKLAILAAFGAAVLIAYWVASKTAPTQWELGGGGYARYR